MKFDGVDGIYNQGQMAPEILIDVAIKGLQKDHLEIYPGLAGMMNVMSRLAPKFLLSQTSKAGAKKWKDNYQEV